VLLLAITQIAFAAPQVILAPLADVLADRWDRRVVMILSDFGAGMGGWRNVVSRGKCASIVPM
jgi:hypothetical protein